jgi:hypothetical protein
MLDEALMDFFPKEKEMEFKSAQSSKSSESKRKAKQNEKLLARQQEVADRLCLHVEEDEVSEEKSGDFCEGVYRGDR